MKISIDEAHLLMSAHGEHDKEAIVADVGDLPGSADKHQLHAMLGKLVDNQLLRCPSPGAKLEITALGISALAVFRAHHAAAERRCARFGASLFG